MYQLLDERIYQAIEDFVWNKGKKDNDKQTSHPYEKLQMYNQLYLIKAISLNNAIISYRPTRKIS